MTVDSTAADQTRRPEGADGDVALPPGLDWVSRLPSTAAPGFVYLAGACRGIAVGGGGRDLAEAAARLGGEAAEVSAQLAAPVACDLPGDRAIERLWSGAGVPLRVAAVDLADGRAIGVPAAAIFLDDASVAGRAAAAPPASLGLAAGPSVDAARLSGLLEVIERDAAAGWWNEGRSGWQLADGLAPDLAPLRAGVAAPMRATGFIRLASPLGVPVVCAVSRDAGGGGLAFGLKAALDPAAAAEGAAIELLQMELALEMARLRAARGAAAAGDRAPLARADLAVDGIDAFAARLPVPEAPGPRDLAALVALCAARGMRVIAADLPAEHGLAVAKIFVPGMRPLPWAGATARSGTPGAIAALM